MTNSKKKTQDFNAGLKSFVENVPAGAPLQPSMLPVPPYEDKGVKFQGYAKQEIGPNSYKLFQQRERNFYYTGKIGSDYIDRQANGSLLGTTYYIQSVIISFGIAAGNDTENLVTIFNGYFGVGGINPVVNIPVQNRTQTIQIRFDTPIKITSNNIGLEVGASYGASDYFSITILGFEEAAS